MADNITQVGNKTLVSKIVYGTPYRTAIISSAADINAIAGLNISGAVDGSLIIYDSDAGEWRSGSLIENLIIDGRVYPSDSDRTQILIRRSGTQGDPLKLRAGELAYSWLVDSETNGFGNGGDRLFIGVGNETEVNGELVSERIEVIGGKYFTDLLNHQHGVLTASSALIADSSKRIDEIYVDRIYADSAFLSAADITGNATLQNLDVAQSFTFNNAVGTGTTSLQQLTTTQLDVLGPSSFDSAVLIKDTLTVNGAVRIDSSLEVIGEANLSTANVDALNVKDTINVESDATFFIGDRLLREFIDSSVFNLLVAGQAVTLTYNDSANTLEVAVQTATVNSPGVASFDSDQFSVDSSGAVSILELNGGTF